MFSSEKKPYDAPDIEKIPLSDQDLDKVSGGLDGQNDDDSDDWDIMYNIDETTNPTGSMDCFRSEEDIRSEPGKAQVGRGGGRGGGCDDVVYRKSARTFSSGRSKC